MLTSVLKNWQTSGAAVVLTAACFVLPIWFPHWQSQIQQTAVVLASLGLLAAKDPGKP